MGKRRRAREMAMQMLYQYELGGSPLPQIFSSFELGGHLSEAAAVTTDASSPEPLPEPPAQTDPAQPDPAQPDPAQPASGTDRENQRARRSFAYARRLVEGTIEHRASIDALIRRHAENWRLERMPTIDRNILRLAIYEMLHESSVPKVVIVDEAIELAKKFGSENSGRFVNGLLDGLLQSSPALSAVAGEAARAESR